MQIAARALGIAPSATLAVSSLAKRLKAEGKDVIDFGVGEPDFDTPDFIKDAAKAALDAGFTKYTDVAGIPELRKAIAARYQADYGVSYAPEQIVVSNGGKQSLYNVMQCLINPGDEVLLPVPYWVTYEEQIKLAGGIPVLVPMPTLRLTAQSVREHLTPRTTALILNSPSNPSGMVYERSEIEQIVALAVEHNFIIISDEVYEHLVYEGTPFTCVPSLGKEAYDHTIVVSAVSKTYSMTGWRIGWTASSVDLAKAMANLQSHATSNANSIAQRAAYTALTGSRDFLEEWKRAFDERRHFMVDTLNACPGMTCAMPDGAFYAFPDVSATGLTGTEFAKRLLETQQVAVVPGIAFGDDRYVRLSYAVSMDMIREGMRRISEFVATVR